MIAGQVAKLQPHLETPSSSSLRYCGIILFKFLFLSPPTSRMCIFERRHLACKLLGFALSVLPFHFRAQILASAECDTSSLRGTYVQVY